MIFLSMNKGDTITLTVNVNYETAPSGNEFLGTAYDVLFNSFDAAYGSGVEHGVNSSSRVFDEALNGIDMSGKGNSSTAPRAFLNYIFFNQEMNYVRAGFLQITTAAQGIGVHQTISLNDIIADQEGYLLGYLSNENTEAVNIHFDDFVVYHSKTNVVYSSDYYPFGYQYNEYQRTASTDVRYRFQEQEHDKRAGLNIFKHRDQDPLTGRFLQIDPLASDYVHNSTYAFAENRVVDGIDLEGLEYLRTIDKFQYTGDATDYFKSIPNAATDVVNYGISLYNTATSYAVGDANIIGNEKAGLQAIGSAASGAVEYLTNTPGSQMLSDAGDFMSSPDFFGETALGLLFGGSTKLGKLSRRSSPASTPKSFSLDDITINDLDILQGNADLGWFDGNTLNMNINSIQKNPLSPKNSGFNNLIDYTENLARDNGLSDVRIEFGPVMNSRLATDGTWAREHGYFYSSYKDNLGNTVVTWEKTLK